MSVAASQWVSDGASFTVAPLQAIRAAFMSALGAQSRPQDFGELYEAEFDYVWSSLRRVGVPPSHLEDLAQDVFVTAWRRIDSYDPTRPLRPWLFGIAFRLASDFRNRASTVREVYSEPEDIEDSQLAPDEIVARRQAQALVQRALTHIPLERRGVFVLHDIDGVGIPEVAEIFEIPLNTAYSRLRLARRDFAAAVEKMNAEAVA